MKFTGFLKEPIIDYITGKLTILFEPCEDFREAYEHLKGCGKLTLEIKKYKAKRSLDANGYYWVLLTKFAKIIGISNTEAHNILLGRYGQIELFDGRPAYMIIPETEEAEKEARNSSTIHLQPTSQVCEGNDGVMYRTYRLLRGSSDYDTSEMARLIEGLVYECIEVGIPRAEIATPAEKRILEKRYGVEFG